MPLRKPTRRNAPGATPAPALDPTATTFVPGPIGSVATTFAPAIGAQARTAPTPPVQVRAAGFLRKQFRKLPGQTKTPAPAPTAAGAAAAYVPAINAKLAGFAGVAPAGAAAGAGVAGAFRDATSGGAAPEVEGAQGESFAAGIERKLAGFAALAPAGAGGRAGVADAFRDATSGGAAPEVEGAQGESFAAAIERKLAGYGALPGDLSGVALGAFRDGYSAGSSAPPQGGVDYAAAIDAKLASYQQMPANPAASVTSAFRSAYPGSAGAGAPAQAQPGLLARVIAWLRRNFHNQRAPASIGNTYAQQFAGKTAGYASNAGNGASVTAAFRKAYPGSEETSGAASFSDLLDRKRSALAGGGAELEFLNRL